MASTLRRSMVLASVLFACGGDDDGESGGEAGDTAGETSGTAGNTTSMSGTNANTTAMESESGTSNATAMTGSGSAEVSSEGGSSGQTGGLDCDPDAPDMCLACLGEVCCEELMACAGDPDCACMAACIGAGGEAGGCLGDCMIAAPPADLMPLTTCMIASCPDADECGPV